MENNLIISQLVFYIAGSVVIIILGILLSIVIYHIISITSNLKKASQNFRKVTDTAGNSLSSLIEQLLKLPVLASILTFFLNKKEKSSKQTKKSSEKNGKK